MSATEPSPPLCPECLEPMRRFALSANGAITYLCACSGQVRWQTIHPWDRREGGKHVG